MAHAILSPSSAHRWLKCTPSARLESLEPATESSAAAEGTNAHKLAEVLLKSLNGENLTPEEVKEPYLSDYYSQEMDRHIEGYVNLITKRSEGGAVLIEKRVSLDKYAPQSFGTVDCIILKDGVMEIIDLKYGQGVAVSAKNNPQLRLYALGAYNEFNFIYDIDKVKMTIYQPRRDGESSEELTIKELLEWGESIKSRAKMAFNGEGVMTDGKHCKFCKVQYKCPQMLKEFEKLDCESLPTDENKIKAVLDKADTVIEFINQVKNYAYQRALSGQSVKGYKLVQGRSTRKYTDEAQIAKILTNAGFKDFYKPSSLIGVGEMEKLLGKQGFSELLSDYVKKTAPKPSLVKASDPREAFNSAVSDFKGEIENDN